VGERKQVQIKTEEHHPSEGSWCCVGWGGGHGEKNEVGEEKEGGAKTLNGKGGGQPWWLGQKNRNESPLWGRERIWANATLKCRKQFRRGSGRGKEKKRRVSLVHK